MYRVFTKVLMVEDNPVDALLLQEILAHDRDGQFETELAGDLAQALERLGQADIDVVLLDLSLPDSHGLETFLKVHERAPHLPIVVLTGMDDEDLAQEAVKAGAQDYLFKADADKNLITRALRYAISRKQAERAVQDSKRFLASTLNALTTNIAILDRGGKVVAVNSAWRRFAETRRFAESVFGIGASFEDICEEACGESSDDAAAAAAGIREVMECKLNEFSLEYQCRVSKERSWFTLRATRFETPGVHVVIALENITQRMSLEEQLRQSQKMEAIGRLAGGVAHDFNNLLTVITGYGEVLLSQLKPHDPTYKEIEQIHLAGMRAATLTRQLLAFSRRQMLQLRVMDINTVVANLDRMMRRLIGEDIDLLTVLAPNLGAIKADPGQIEQILMNLAVNARDAMPNGGKLTIETANIYLDEYYAFKHIAVRPGHYVMLVISDTGCGMDAATQAQAFEPFFTTKDKSKGTGLGLSTVYGIVKQSGGNIWVYSEPGQGATFKIYFPQVVDQAEEALDIKMPVFNPARQSETVLVVEDEEVVRSLICGILETNGYSVLTAQHGAEALKICEQFPGTIHLVITDVVMPRMSGQELSQRLLPLRPETRILFISGYADNAILHSGILDRGRAFLQKPFSPAALARKAREVLDAPAPAPASAK